MKISFGIYLTIAIASGTATGLIAALIEYVLIKPIVVERVVVPKIDADYYTRESMRLHQEFRDAILRGHPMADREVIIKSPRGGSRD